MPASVPPSILRLRFQHLALLSALADRRTLHEAAAALQIGQPSASKMLADIESAFGFALFERQPRGMNATPLGREVIAYARQVQGGLSHFAGTIEQQRRGGHGELTFGAATGSASDLVAPAVAAVKRERPRLKVRIVTDAGPRLELLLARREIEFAFSQPADGAQHGFDFAPLARERLEFVVRGAHPLAQRRRLTWQRLLDWPWILPTRAAEARQRLDEMLVHAALPAPADLVECTSYFASLQLLQGTDAIALLPVSVTREHVKARLVKPLPVPNLQEPHPLGVLTRKDEALSPAAASVLRHLRLSLQGQAT